MENIGLDPNTFRFKKGKDIIMKQTVEEAAMQELMSSYAIVTEGELVYQRQAMLNMFKKGAEWQAKQLSCVSAYEKLLESNKDDFLSHHIDKVKMEIIRIVANDRKQ